MVAADQLMLWHGRTAPQVVQEPARTRCVVLLAACIHDRAAAMDLGGAATVGVQLGQAAEILEGHLVSALEACATLSLPSVEGGDVVDELLAGYGTDGFEHIRQMVRQALAHHRADSGPHVRITERIAERRSALRDTLADLCMDY
ncbi:hypothetical protein ACFV8E_39640 [Streptomyces sp. NPDC059849]|uniref:hypothetical protein n=1 Tax=Streptomyces sp. NPDC059849 TaxID=3346969 RepID=UPI00366534FD